MLRSIRDVRSFLSVTAIAMVGAAGGIVWWESQLAWKPTQAYAQQTAIAESARSNLAAYAGADQLSAAFREVARALKPSVVSIHSIVEAKQPRAGVRRGQRGLPPEFEQFFGRGFGLPFDIPEFESPDQPEGPRQAGQGSGVIVSREGHILTNNHVVEGADKLEVVLSDDRKVEAKIIGTDPKADIALLKIEATGLVAAPIGDSSIMQVGDWVIAIGSPFGLSQTVTSGIISATHRDDFQITDYDDFIQTDAAINPGNSGGPLLNLRGEVIGINTAIASRGGGFNGVGFAIPSNTADSIMKSILKYGKVTRGFIGTQIGDVTDELAANRGVPAGTKGAYVSVVSTGGPADKGGLQPGDIVTAINGEKITSSSQLKHRVASFSPGQSVKFEVFRDGKTLTLTIVVEEQTDDKLAALSGKGAASAIGIVVDKISPEVAREYGLAKGAGGVVITEISNDSPLANELSIGEIILSVNGERVSTPAEFTTALGKNTEYLRLIVRNANTVREVRVRLR